MSRVELCYEIFEVNDFRDGLAKTAKFANLMIFYDDLAKTRKFVEGLPRPHLHFLVTFCKWPCKT